VGRYQYSELGKRGDLVQERLFLLGLGERGEPYDTRIEQPAEMILDEARVIPEKKLAGLLRHGALCRCGNCLGVLELINSRPGSGFWLTDFTKKSHSVLDRTYEWTFYFLVSQVGICYQGHWFPSSTRRAIDWVAGQLTLEPTRSQGKTLLNFWYRVPVLIDFIEDNGKKKQKGMWILSANAKSHLDSRAQAVMARGTLKKQSE